MAQGHQDVRPGTPPLAGIRVIERTNLLSGRLAGLLLADQGAPKSSRTAPRPTLAADQHAGLDNGYFDRGKIALPDGAAADAASVDIVIVDGTAEFARRIENAGALRVRSARTRAAHDVFDVAAADADIAQFMIRELRQFAHRVSIPAPSVELLRDHFEGDHLDSFSDAPRRLLGRKPIVAGAHGGRTAQLAKFLREGLFRQRLVACVPELIEGSSGLARRITLHFGDRRGDDEVNELDVAGGGRRRKMRLALLDLCGPVWFERNYKFTLRRLPGRGSSGSVDPIVLPSSNCARAVPLLPGLPRLR
jgi:hypothetical protein